MNHRTEILSQIRHITQALVANSIAIDQNYPKQNGSEIVWEKFKNLAFTLKDEDYSIMYTECLKNQDYNFLLLDGALIQLRYDFKHGTICKHVLSYYPHPQIDSYDESSNFENDYFGNELFSHISAKEIIRFPIRFDYSDVFTELHHPYSHATLGNYSSCRIPINKPISPINFMNFVLRNFYNSKFIECEKALKFLCGLRMDETISKLEKSIIHLNIQ